MNSIEQALAKKVFYYSLPIFHFSLPTYADFIRWAFTRFYREFAWTYDTVAAAVSGGQWSMWTLTALSFLRGQVLELGCGTGNLQHALAHQPHTTAIGIDLSRQMLAISRSKLERTGMSIRLARANTGALPFPGQVFDTLVATFPSEYIVAPETLTEVRRVLRPHGQLVVILAAHNHRRTLYHRLIDVLYRATLQRPLIAATPVPPTSVVGERCQHAGFAVREFWHPAGGGVDLHMIIAQV